MPSAENTNWEALARLDEALYCRADKVPHNRARSIGLHLFGLLFQSRRLVWGNGSTCYSYRASRPKFRAFSLYVGVSSVADVSEVQNVTPEHDVARAVMVVRTIRYFVTEPRVTGTIDKVYQDTFVVPNTFSDPGAFLSQRQVSESIQDDFGISRPDLETHQQLAAFLEMGEELTRFKEPGKR